MSTPISSILIGGVGRGGLHSKHRRTAVPVKAPEIDSASAASALTLLLGSLIVLGSKRPEVGNGRRGQPLKITHDSKKGRPRSRRPVAMMPSPAALLPLSP